MDDWKRELERLDEANPQELDQGQGKGHFDAAARQAWFERVNRFLDKVVAHPFKELAAELVKHNRHVSYGSGRWSRTLRVEFGNGNEMKYVIGVKPDPGDPTVWQEFKLRDEDGEVLEGGVALPVMQDNSPATISHITNGDIIKAFMECYRAALRRSTR